MPKFHEPTPYQAIDLDQTQRKAMIKINGMSHAVQLQESVDYRSPFSPARHGTMIRFYGVDAEGMSVMSQECFRPMFMMRPGVRLATQADFDEFCYLDDVNKNINLSPNALVWKYYLDQIQA